LEGKRKGKKRVSDRGGVKLEKSPGIVPHAGTGGLPSFLFIPSLEGREVLRGNPRNTRTLCWGRKEKKGPSKKE